MPQTTDDLEAVRTIVKALEPFDAKEQDRIIRWAKEKLGHSVEPAPSQITSSIPPPSGSPQQTLQSGSGQLDIKAFVGQKNPKTDNQLAATVAYYHRFEAPVAQRKDTITKEDLREACRLANIDRLHRPEQTLVNAHHAGLLDKGSEKGTYAINSVGENLVAMTLPSASKKNTPRKKITKKPRRRTKK